MADNGGNKKRVRDYGSSELDTPEIKRIRDDLLCILDESDPDPVSQDLESVMKSLEDAISTKNVVVVDLTSSDSGESQSELGYLLEGFDDDLGLPPPPPSHGKGEEGEKNKVTELVRVDSVESGGFWGFEEQIPSYDSYEFGIDENYNTDYYVEFDDGLFEHSTVGFDLF